MQHVIVDSSMSAEEALRQNPLRPCPDSVIDALVLFDVEYYSFDGKIHRGQIAAHTDLVDDIKGAFKLLVSEKFPIQSAVPIADRKYLWDDTPSTIANNCSAFNYRNVRNTETLSHHSLGRAIDINPLLNPYFPGKKTFPPHSSYDKRVVGTILEDSMLVTYFKDLGWVWGGNWDEDPDYQHFEKLA